MALMLKSTGCCAVREIYQLNHHKGDSLAAMKEFCRLHDYSAGGSLCGLYAFYIFTGVVKTDDKEPVGYGEAFEEFIRKNKLGTICRSVARVNRVNHPNHYVKVWVWAPSKDNLQAWWNKHKPERKAWS